MHVWYPKKLSKYKVHCAQEIYPPQMDRNTKRDLRTSLRCLFPETIYYHYDHFGNSERHNYLTISLLTTDIKNIVN